MKAQVRRTRVTEPMRQAIYACLVKGVESLNVDDKREIINLQQNGKLNFDSRGRLVLDKRIAANLLYPGLKPAWLKRELAQETQEMNMKWYTANVTSASSPEREISTAKEKPMAHQEEDEEEYEEYEEYDEDYDEEDEEYDEDYDEEDEEYDEDYDEEDEDYDEDYDRRDEEADLLKG